MARIDRDMAETAQLCAERRKLMAERLKLEAEQLRRGRGWLPPDLLGLALVVGAVAGLVPWLLPGACSR